MDVRLGQIYEIIERAKKRLEKLNTQMQNASTPTRRATAQNKWNAIQINLRNLMLASQPVASKLQKKALEEKRPFSRMILVEDKEVNLFYRKLQKCLKTTK